LRQLVVLEQLAVFVGHDELVGFLAVGDREAVVLVVLDEADDFELVLLAVRRLDDEGVAELDFPFAGVAVVSVDCRPP
jgi:hypothetical protein